jgi:hypothetical protein
MSNQNDSFVTINDNNSFLETKASFNDIGNNEGNNINYLLQEYEILSNQSLEDLNNR